MSYISDMKNIITLILSFITLNGYSQFVLSAEYTINDTTNNYVDTLLTHYDLDLSKYQFITYSDSIYDVLTWDNYQVTGYNCFKYGEKEPSIMFTKELFNTDGPKSDVGYVIIEDLDYVSLSYGRDRTTIYIFD
jgi:hypothetical protein